MAADNDPPRVNRIPHFPILEENNVRKGFLEHEAYTKLRDALPAGVQLLLAVAYQVGCRRGELLKIRWPQVDLNAKRIRLEPGTTKNKEGRTLPVYCEVVEWLRVEKEIRDAKFPPASTSFTTTASQSRTSASPGMRRARRRPRRSDVSGPAPHRSPQHGPSWHSRRKPAWRSAATRSVFDRYNIVNDRDLTEAAVRMEQHLKSLGILSGIPAENEQPKDEGEKPTSRWQ
jgi:integrase